MPDAIDQYHDTGDYKQHENYHITLLAFLNNRRNTILYDRSDLGDRVCHSGQIPM